MSELGKAIEKSTGKAPASLILTQLKEWKDKNISQLEKFLGEKRKHEAERLYLAFVYSVNRNPALLECSKSSLIESLLNCAQFRLYPGPLQEAAIVPYKREAQFQPMYQGLVKLGMESGFLIDIHANVIHENDQFDFQEGTSKYIIHRKLLRGDRGEPYGVYAAATLKNGGHEFVIMTKDEVMAIKKKSRAKDDGPWVTDELAMWKKTAIKQLCKLLPKQGEEGELLAKAIDHDNAVERPDLAKKPIFEMGETEVLDREEEGA